MTRLVADWLKDPPLSQLFDLFETEGHKLFCVGGCVRDAVLGRKVSDIDLSTDALPDKVVAIAQAAGLRSIPTGLEHGTVTVMSGSVPFEITTFRKDIDTDGRHATVAFSKSLEEDALRRDLKINALYADRHGEITDPTGGLADLAAGKVRFIGRPDKRIAEDYLRILRFFRFHAWYADPGHGVDENGLAACAKGADGLEGLSAERIGTEMIKLLSAPDPAPAVAAMAQSGVLARVMPGAEAATLTVLIHLEAASEPDWITRALTLGGDELQDRWRLTRADARTLKQLRDNLAEPAPIAQLAYRLGPINARRITLARHAAMAQPLPDDLETVLVHASRQVFPVKAEDLMPALTGPALGAKLAELERRWIASGFTLGRDDLLKK